MFGAIWGRNKSMRRYGEMWSWVRVEKINDWRKEFKFDENSPLFKSRQGVVDHLEQNPQSGEILIMSFDLDGMDEEEYFDDDDLDSDDFEESDDDAAHMGDDFYDEEFEGNL